MILVPPHVIHTPPARSCIVKVRETEWVKVGHKLVRITVVKDEHGTWHDGRCVVPVAPKPKPKPTHIPVFKPTVKPTHTPTAPPKVPA